jgi:Protein of unknown function (DUF3126)
MTPTELSKIQSYLRKVYGNRDIAVRPRPQKKDQADMFVGEKPLASIIVDDEDGDRSYQLSWEIKEPPQKLDAAELVRLQTFLRDRLGSKTLSVRARGKLKDSAEVFVGDESYALITADKTSYQFQMAILDIDLEDVE